MRGELDFPSALRERVALLKGLPLEALARVYAEHVRLNPGARALTATMRAHGAHMLLVSGGFTYFTTRVSEDAGFEEEQGNRLLDDGKFLTGKVAEPILGREAKLRALEEGVVRFGLAISDTLAVGDGANDLDMIKRAGLGVAYHAKPVWRPPPKTSIAHGDLTGFALSSRLPSHGNSTAVTGSFTIRAWAPADTEELGEVFRRSVREVAKQRLSPGPDRSLGAGAGQITVWAERMKNRTTFVAEQNGSLIGFIQYEPPDHIDMTYVPSRAATHGSRQRASCGAGK